MNIRFKKTIVALSLTALIVIGFFAIEPLIVHAQVNTGINFAAQTGLGSTDPRVTIARVIRIALGFLGVIALGLILYAGFIWMTAKGEEEKINQAKKILTGAVIGLAIVLASFAIASFVLGKLMGSTGGGGSGGVCNPSCSSGQYCCNSSCQSTPCNTIGGGSDVFVVSGTTPANKTVNVPRNAVIRYRFSKALDTGTVNQGSFVVSSGDSTSTGNQAGVGNGPVVSGQISSNGSYIEFVPEAACEAPHEDLKCFSANTVINVLAKNGSGGIISLDKQELTCSGGSNCGIQFTTGEMVDVEAPRVNLTTQQICAGATNTLRSSAIDNYGVSKIDFFAADKLIDSKINDSDPFVASPFNAEVSWDASGLSEGQTIALMATAYDLDSNNASAQKDLKLSPTHCCNGIQDADETGIDCGGSCLSCGAFNRPIINSITPAGGFCSNDVNKFCRQSSDCASGGNCDLGTPNGATGNFVTLIGSGFGTTRGKVFFTNASGAQVEAVLADDASAGNPVCSNAVWKDNQIIAVVPAGASVGKIQIRTSGNVIESSDDEFGPLFNNFKKNTIDRPGICALSPAAGKLNDAVDYNGIKLSSAEAYYGNLSANLKALVSSFPNAKQGTATVPNLASGATTTYVTTTNIESNFLPFTKENEPYNGPIISSVEPLSGPVGQYVTIRGSGFGSPRGTSKIFFGGENGTQADYLFPDVCAQNLWTDNQIIVKVPSGIAAGQNYKVTLTRPGFSAVDSGTQEFSVTTGSPDPGICRVQPSLGRANSEVSFWGEYFRNKDANSAVRFYNNQEQRGNAISFWAIDEGASGIKPWKVVTTVPQSAVTGPTRIVVGSPAQLSNSLNFTVGQCTKDADCGASATCCAAGLPEAGKCKDQAAECYGSVARSVYEWQFSTGSQSTCAPDQEKCGTACCAIGSCEDPAQNKCQGCLSGQNLCQSGECCNKACEGDPSSCSDPASCSGYSHNQCLEGFYCPNSPGLCSAYPGNGGSTVVGDCGDNVCFGKPGCSGINTCHYDAGLNRCVQDTSSCKKTEMKDSDGNVIKINNQPAVGFCDTYSNSPHWNISGITGFCPSGWTLTTVNNVRRCVDTMVNSINGACSKCASPTTCQISGTEGKCAIDPLICPAGSTCNATNNKCEELDLGTCDCCCEKNDNVTDPETGQITNPGCCAGLSCDGTCGSGGTQQNPLGLCSGCVVNGEPDDSLCNCVGTTGKFCDNSENPRGVCNDCSSITDPTECSQHAECCVDGKNNGRCTSVVTGGSRFEKDNLQYCAYYNCSNTYPNLCLENKPTANGVYNKLTNCQQGCTSAPIACSTQDQCANPSCPANMRCDLTSCECKSNNPGPGVPCRDPLTNACTGRCSAGYQCLLPSAYNGNGAQQGAPVNEAQSGAGGNGQDTCRCCCKPPTGPGEIDTCKQINSDLTCLANQGACTSPTGQRGLCCGCSKDAQCGDVATTGCGLTDARCCQTRPSVTDHYPAVNEQNVCRNALIEAVFDQKMDIASFSGSQGQPNVLLIGDYGSKPCPVGYQPVATAAAPNGTFAKIFFTLKQIAANVFPSLGTHPAFADTQNICYVPGSPVGSELDATRTKVDYRIVKALDANVRYYVILKGDPALGQTGEENTKDYYNGNIQNRAKIGLMGAVQGRIPNTFKSTVFQNAEIWSFTTGSDVCLLDKVKVDPSFQLFQKSGDKGDLQATALDRGNRPIYSIPGVYGWDWDWSSDNSDIAQVVETDPQDHAQVTAGNKQDATTFGRAQATITVDTINQNSTAGLKKSGTAQLRLFLCENPWPVYYAYPPFPPNYTWPWKDTNSGIEFYYCRDKSGSGTIDDLPALQEEPVVKNNGRNICMFGANVGRVCTSDANCGSIAGSCLPEVLKEFFFFRENEPGIPNLSGEADNAGKKVNLRWQATPNAVKYKVYYGLNPGQYVYTVEVPGGAGEISKSIEGLVNGLNYYFTVTALSSKNQESIFSNELKIKPADKQAPVAPTLQASSGDGKISLFWQPVPEAVSYIAYLGTEPRGNGEYPASTIVRTTPPANIPNAIFTSIGGSGLNNATTYYVSVRALDQYGNISEYAAEIAKKPNQPYLISLQGSGQDSITAKWLPFISATSYTVYYGTRPGSRDNEVTATNTTFQKAISGLNLNTTYYVTVQANGPGTHQSDFSNERSAQAGDRGEGN